MTQVSEDYIRDLEPEALRYDVTIEDDFVVSVLPNGIKTWAFLYEYKGRQRRKTLGIYPEMSYSQANDALRNARAMVSRLGADMDAAGEPAAPPIPTGATLGDTAAARPAILASGYGRRSSHIRMRSENPAKWPKYLLYAVLAAVLLGGGYFATTRLILDDGSDVPAADSVAPAVAPPRQDSGGSRSTAPAISEPVESTVDSPQPGPRSNPFSLSNQNQAPDDSPKPGGEAPATESEDNTQETPDPSGSAVPRPLPAPESAPPATPAAQARPDTSTGADPRRASDPGPAGAGPASADTAQELVVVPATSSTSATTSRKPPATAQRPPPVKPAPATNSSPSRAEPAPEGATATGGSVARAIVTSGVDNLEPVDDLGDWVALRNNGYQSVFFFTELRNFSDGNVIHRWVHNDRILADVPLRVARSWRWRTYSSKDLLPGMTGDWSVSVIDARGEILASRSFTFEND